MKRKYEELNDFLIKGFLELGCDRKVAFEVAKSLLDAEFSGVSSHGLSMAIQPVSYTHLTLPTNSLV